MCVECKSFIKETARRCAHCSCVQDAHENDIPARQLARGRSEEDYQSIDSRSMDNTLSTEMQTESVKPTQPTQEIKGDLK